MSRPATRPAPLAPSHPALFRYAAEATQSGSPLSTLYSLFAGSGTAVLDVSGASASPAGRWAENLAMMLANPTTDDTEVITQLGDRIRHTEGACAAHVCYLLAEAPVTLAAAAPPRFRLLGYDEVSGGFPPLECIRATELYVACRTSLDSEFDGAGLHAPLLLYAHALSESGHHAQAALYLRELGRTRAMPSWTAGFAARFEQLSQHLQAHGIALDWPADEPEQQHALGYEQQQYEQCGAEQYGAEQYSQPGYASQGAEGDATDLNGGSYDGGYGAAGSGAGYSGDGSTQPEPSQEPHEQHATVQQEYQGYGQYEPPQQQAPQEEPLDCSDAAEPAAARSSFGTPALPRAQPASSPEAAREPPAPAPAATPASARPSRGKSVGLGDESPRRSGILSGLRAIASFLPGKKDTQLEDQCDIKYNEKYKAWIPGDRDPDEWAKENLAAPPPPPSMGGEPPSEVHSAGGPPGMMGGGAPQTPMAGGFPGVDGARFSGRSSARRKPTSCYVDTFNADAMPLPAPKPKPPVPQFKIFTPTAAPAEADAATELPRCAPRPRGGSARIREVAGRGGRG